MDSEAHSQWPRQGPLPPPQGPLHLHNRTNFYYPESRYRPQAIQAGNASAVDLALPMARCLPPRESICFRTYMDFTGNGSLMTFLGEIINKYCIYFGVVGGGSEY
eukprot:401038-Amorphochlora_amoeboformis.AAC.1